MPFHKGYTPWNKKENKQEIIKCSCGCNQDMEKFDNRGRPRKFIYKHGYNKGKKFPNTKHGKQFKTGDTPWNKGKHIENSGTYKKGHTQNLGRKHTKETRDKMSEAQLGKEATIKGDRHWKWKGGITSKNKVDRAKFNKNYAPLVLKKDDYTCQICHTRGGVLHADHIKSWADYPELRFDLSNCRTLCRKCHYEITFGKKMPENSKWGLKTNYSC